MTGERDHRRRRSPLGHVRANLVAYLALFLALTGSAAATTAQLVTSADIADGSIVNADVSPSAAIAGSKLAADSVTGARVVESSLARVPNADRIDGVDSNALLRGTGRYVRATLAIGESTQIRIPGLPVDTLVLECANLFAGVLGPDGQPVAPLGGLRANSTSRTAVLLGTLIAAELGRADEPGIPVGIEAQQFQIALVPWVETPGFPADQPVAGVLPAENAWHRAELTVHDAAAGQTAWVDYLGHGGANGCVADWRSVRSAVAP